MEHHHEKNIEERSCNIAAKAVAGVGVLTLKKFSHPLIGVVNQQKKQQLLKPVLFPIASHCDTFTQIVLTKC